MGFTCKNFIYEPRIVRPVEEGHDHRAGQDDAAGGLPRVPRRAVDDGPHRGAEGQRAAHRRVPQAKSETVPIYKGGSRQRGPDRPLVIRPTHVSAETERRARRRSSRRRATSATPAACSSSPTTRATCATWSSLARESTSRATSDGIYTIPVEYADAKQLAKAQRDPRHRRAAAAAVASRRRRAAGRRAGRPGQARRRRDGRRGAVEDPRRRSHQHADRRRPARPATCACGRWSKRLDIAARHRGRAARSTSTRSRTRRRGAGARRSTTRSGHAAAAQRAARPARAHRNPAGRPGRRRAARPVATLAPRFEGQVRVTPDKPTNSLVVIASAATSSRCAR